MLFIWFIYGLAFFTLGLVIIVFPKKGSDFKLANHIWLIAAFGILHGTNEWLDMFIEIGEPFPPDVLRVIRLITLIGSFIFMLRFGTKVIAQINKKLKPLKTLPFVLFAAWLTIFLLADNRILFGDIFSRYLLCAPGGFLTAIAFFMQVPQFKKTKNHAIIRNLKITAVVFALYTVFAGLIVKKAPIFPATIVNYDVFKSITGGIPVQIFRAICAVVLAYSTSQILAIFRWETQNKLRQSELRFHSIAAEAPVILFIADNRCNITFIDGKGIETLGIKKNDLVGRHVNTIFPEETKILSLSKRALNGEEFVAVVAGNDLLFETYFGPMRDEEEDITGLIGVAVDVTQRAKAQAQLDSYRNEMINTKQLASLGTMSSNMANKLTEPLTVARVFLQRLSADLSKTQKDDSTVKKVQDSLAEISKAAEIIDKFYVEAHITPNPKAQPIDLYQTVQRIIAVLTDSAQRARLQINTAGIDVVPCLRISQKELEQIFFILIQNAIEAADGLEPRTLAIDCQITPKEINVRFTDTCGGISPEKTKDIFQPFALAKDNGKGPGLGLAIVKRIINAYKGQIEAELTPGSGTTFIVTLPIEGIY